MLVSDGPKYDLKQLTKEKICALMAVNLETISKFVVEVEKFSLCEKSRLLEPEEFYKISEIKPM